MKRDIYITTVSGARFYFESPEDSVIRITDIAHALARICRYSGHIKAKNSIYSVAQHSYMCAFYLQNKGFSRELCLAALLHDSAEAYLGDITGPVKVLIPELKAIERRIERVLEKYFGLPEGSFEWPEVKAVDLAIRRNEADSLCSGAENLCAVTDYKTDGIEALDLPGPIRPWGVREAQYNFIGAFQVLRSPLTST